MAWILGIAMFTWCIACGASIAIYFRSNTNRWVGWDIICLVFITGMILLLLELQIIVAPWGLYDPDKGVMPPAAWINLGLLFALAGTVPAYLGKIFRSI